MSVWKGLARRFQLRRCREVELVDARQLVSAFHHDRVRFLAVLRGMYFRDENRMGELIREASLVDAEFWGHLVGDPVCQKELLSWALRKHRSIRGRRECGTAGRCNVMACPDGTA